MLPLSNFLSYSRQAGRRLWDLVKHLRYLTSLTDTKLELVIYVAARAANPYYFWNAHRELEWRHAPVGRCSRFWKPTL